MSELLHDIKELIALGECPCKSAAWKHWDETLARAADHIEAQAARIAELEAALPKTADGVPLRSQMEVWTCDTDDDDDEARSVIRLLVETWADGEVPIRCLDPLTLDGYVVYGHEAYSTREAAEAAREGGG